MRRSMMLLLTAAAVAVAAPGSAQSAEWWTPRGPTFDWHGVDRDGGPGVRSEQRNSSEGEIERCEGRGWERVAWSDVSFLHESPAQEGLLLEARSLQRMLDGAVLDRLEQHATARGLDGALNGRWVEMGAGPSVLQLRFGDDPLAEFTDLDRDDHADIVLMFDV